MLRVACYLRNSTEEQSERETTKSQRLYLERKLAPDLDPGSPNPVKIIGWYEDAGVTGTMPMPDRPAGGRLLADARSGAFDLVLVYKLDRLGRRLRVILDAYETLDQCGVSLRSATEPLDTTHPMGRFFFHLLASVAELERETIRERMLTGRDRSAAEGRWPGGRVPYGYDVVDGRLTPSCRMVPEVQRTEAELASWLFEQAASGITPYALAEKLNALGVPNITKYRTHETELRSAWFDGRLRKMFKNTVYKGELRIEQRGKLHVIPVPAIVSPALWARVQHQIRQNRSLSKRNTQLREYLLRGLIRCSSCGWRYTGRPGVKRALSGKEPLYYRCSSDVIWIPGKTTRCHSKGIRVEVLDAFVWEQVDRLLANPDDAIAELQAELEQRRVDRTLELDLLALRQQIVQLEAGKEAVLQLARRGRMTVAEADRQLAQSDDEIAALSRELHRLEAQQRLSEAASKRLAQVPELLSRLRAHYDRIKHADIDTQRTWLSQLIDSIEAGTATDAQGQRRAWAKLRLVVGQPRLLEANDGDTSENSGCAIDIEDTTLRCCPW